MPSDRSGGLEARRVLRLGVLLGSLPSRTRNSKPGAIRRGASLRRCRPPQAPVAGHPTDLTVEAQVSAPSATWIDRQLLAKDFCAPLFARDLLNTLRQRELDEATARLAAEIGLARPPSAEGEYVLGVYRRRVTLAAGRFAMIDDGMGFQLAPWSPALDQTFSDREADRTIPPARRSTGWSRPGRP